MRRSLALALALAACTEFPEFDAPDIVAAERAPYPQLVPLTRILDRADAPERYSQAEADALLARAGRIGGVAAAPGTGDIAARLARLRARAQVLRGPLASEDDVERMRRALAGL